MGSAKWSVHHITEALEGYAADLAQLLLLRIILKEKLETIKTLDVKIVDLIDDGGLADEIDT